MYGRCDPETELALVERQQEALRNGARLMTNAHAGRRRPGLLRGTRVRLGRLLVGFGLAIAGAEA